MSGSLSHLQSALTSIHVIFSFPPQPPMQPGCTPLPDPATASSGVNRGYRFLSYNTLGFVSTGPGMDEDCASVEVWTGKTCGAL